VTIPSYGIRARLVAGTNVVQFTPDRSGTIAYTCWMGMISSTIRVVDDLGRLTASDVTAPPPASIASAFGQGSTGGSCCGPTPPAFAGGKIPTAAIQVARLSGGRQEAVVTVDANGYSPAVIVLQKGVKAVIRFDPRALSSCNYLVDFPEYQGRLDLSKGQLETPPLDVTSDFTFQCGMAMLHGYVKVVDDLGTVDMAAVRSTVAAYRPAAGAGGSCCGR
jgi:plastocyanin domain-containing protein